MNKLKVVVVGGGIVGMFASYYLLKSGCEVIIVDRGGSKIEGASGYNSGLISPSSTATPTITHLQLLKSLTGYSAPITFSPLVVIKNLAFFREALKGGIGRSDKIVVELAKKSLDLHKEFLKTFSPDVDLANGVLSVYRSLEVAESHQKETGGELVGPAELRQLGYIADGAIMHREEIAVNPMKLCTFLRTKLAEMGATIKIGAEARILDGETTATISVDGQRIPGDTYVLAAGSWTPQLCRSLGYTLPVLPARGFAMLYNTGGTRVVQHSAIFEDLGVTISQNGQNLLRAISFFEMVGFNSRFNRRRREWLSKMVETHLSGPLRLSEVGYGFRPCASDQLPVLGRIPGHDNFFVATGHCRLGLTLAPVTGYVLASEISSGPGLGVDLSALSPSRF